MSTPTRSASLALSKDSRIIFGNLPGARCRVSATPGATSVVVDDVTELGSNTALYTASAPGMLVVLSTTTATNQGKTANITAINTGTKTLTVSVDFSAILAAGDVIGIIPPLSTELFLNQGHSLDSTLMNDYSMGLTETFNTHNTPMQVEVGGDVPFFQTMTSEGFARLLAHGVGAYKTPTAGTHKYRPSQANDGTFINMPDGTYFVQDGNSVIRKVHYGLFGTKLRLDFPEGGRGTGSISELGSGSLREIGGTGRTFSTGANNWIRTNFVCDTGAGVTFRSAFLDLGGAFGAALSSTPQTTVKNLTVEIDRGAISDRTLGDAYIVKPAELSVTIKVTGTRILQTNAFQQNADGGANDAEPASGAKTETRLLIKAISVADATKTLSIDIPRGIFSSSKPKRDRGRFKEDFEYIGLATLDANQCVSTSVPPFEVTLLNGISKDLSAVL